jgi:putative solute:sodium symporter small subunit
MSKEAFWASATLKRKESQTFFIQTRKEINMQDNHTAEEGYWGAVLKLLFTVLIIWFAVSFGAGIIFAPVLNAIHLGGYPLGFWFAQQGSIYIFVALIFWYAKKMGELDIKYDVHEE